MAYQPDCMDKRLYAFRSDLADQALEGKVKADRYVQPARYQVRYAIADLKPEPCVNGQTQTQVLYGETIKVFERNNGWLWVQAERDGYVGYMAEICADPVQPKPAQSDLMQVNVPTSFVFPEPELKMPPRTTLSMGSLVDIVDTVKTRFTTYGILSDGGAMFMGHLSHANRACDDYVSICELLVNVPYLWGGASGMGIDCSGLVQLAMHMCGKSVLRDSDMQWATVGHQIDAGDDYLQLKRGDLVFWNGHVAVHCGEKKGVPHLVHANGHSMSVAIEPMISALDRIAYLYEKPIGFRRP